MKKLSQSFWLFMVGTTCSVIFSSCMKDTTHRTYTIFTPVYKSKAEVRANIKTGPAQPIEQAGKIFVLGNYIFLNEIDKGIHIIDNANPASPVNKYFITIPGNLDVAVKGNTLYADLYSDMVTLDITDPTQVKLKKLQADVFPFRQYANGFSPDTSMIIVDWIKKDTTVKENFAGWGMNKDFLWTNFQTFSPTTLATGNAAPAGVAGSMARFCLMNDYLYTVTDNAINVFNIQNVIDPVFTKKVGITGGIETIYPFKGNLFIGSRSGMFIYNTTDPQQPAYTGKFIHANACDPVIADDNYAYITLRSGTSCQTFTNQLDIVNITQLNSPQLVKTYALTNPHGLTKRGNILYICDGNAGIKVYDAANVSGLQLLQHIPGLETYDAIALQNILLVVCKNGLNQYSYDAGGKLQLVSKLGYN
jgi:hypothetical protein